MKPKLLSVIRAVLLLLVILFIATIGYKYFRTGSFDFLLLTPIVGLLFFYFITRSKVK